MANRLRAYVRRTMLESAREYAYPAKRRTADSTRSAFMDAMRGVDTGWWRELIYTAPMLEMAHRHRRDIAAALAEYADAAGEPYTYRAFGQRDVPAYEIQHALLSARRAYTLADYRDESPAGAMAEAALIGLRFAVEWYAGELAREYCPDL